MVAEKNEEEEDNSQLKEEEELDEEEGEEAAEEEWEEKGKPGLPRWARIVLMTVPALVFAFLVVLIDILIDIQGKGINPGAIIAITGIGLIGLATIGDLVYRNVFMYKMTQKASRDSWKYKAMLREREAERKASVKHEFLDEEGEEEYVYEEEYEDEDEEYEYEEEYEDEDEEYEYEEEEEEENQYPRSLLLRGGVFSIIIINGIILLALAVILQIALYGGFLTPPSE